MQKQQQIVAVVSTKDTLMADIAESVRRNLHRELDGFIVADKPVPFVVAETEVTRG
jgi:hypothetical protein